MYLPGSRSAVFKAGIEGFRIRETFKKKFSLVSDWIWLLYQIQSAGERDAVVTAAAAAAAVGFLIKRPSGTPTL